MIERTEYLRRLLSWKDEMVIKVVTGLRRCGKSTLLRQYQNLLLDNGVEGAQIISINFEELENEPLLDYKALYRHIKDRLCPDKTTYIFLDEIQKVPSYEKVVDSLYVKPGVDIYISGSNSYMLSGDLATLLSGRYVELSMLPLSFREYCQATKLKDESAFADYMKYGGLPYLAVMEKTDEKAEVYLEGIYNTVIVKDIEERQNRRESETARRKVTDISLLKNIAKFLAGSVGSPISIRSITDYLISSGRKVSANTVTDYVLALSESFIFYPAERYDVVGKQILKSNKKWYIVDTGLRNHILPRRNYDLGFTIENIVFLELLRRGYSVYIGKYETAEIDFVACKHGVYTYIQVTADMNSETTFEREMRPLRKVRDNYEKIVLTLDRFTIGNYDGIKVIHVIDWLLND
ncbi:MAG: ATP-binding protein [Lachnospiraceae bacterium]|nr:ATP-binding protein [Lachnospiraceae bacterium]